MTSVGCLQMPLSADHDVPQPRVLVQVVDALVGDELGGHRGCRRLVQGPQDGEYVGPSSHPTPSGALEPLPADRGQEEHATTPLHVPMDSKTRGGAVDATAGAPPLLPPTSTQK